MLPARRCQVASMYRMLEALPPMVWSGVKSWAFGYAGVSVLPL